MIELVNLLLEYNLLPAQIALISNIYENSDNNNNQ